MPALSFSSTTNYSSSILGFMERTFANKISGNHAEALGLSQVLSGTIRTGPRIRCNWPVWSTWWSGESKMAACTLVHLNCFWPRSHKSTSPRTGSNTNRASRTHGTIKKWFTNFIVTVNM